MLRSRVIALAVLAVLISAAPSWAAPADPYEYDGTRAAAKPVPVGDTVRYLRGQDRSLEPSSDLDWGSFQAKKNVRYHFHTWSDAEVSADLYDQNGKYVMAMPYVSYAFYRWIAPADGTYYVKYQRYRGSSLPTSFPYTIQVAVGPASAAFRDGAEPDETTTAARSLPMRRGIANWDGHDSFAAFAAAPVRTVHDASRSVDVDTFALDLAASDSTTGTARAIRLLADDIAIRYVSFELLDAKGRHLQYSGTVRANPVATFWLSPYPAGRYYVKVSAQDAAPFFYRLYGTSFRVPSP